MLQAEDELSEESEGSFPKLPGCEDFCKDLHSEARDSFLFWRANNSPRYGLLYNDMRCKRSHFKYVRRQCKKDQDITVTDSLAK